MKDCKFCNKDGMLILPLRYAVVVGDPVPSGIQSLPSTLGDKVSDLVLTQAKYAPRSLREGYLYVLLKRSGKYYWQGYFVTEDAYLYKFPISTPPQIPVAFTCEPGICGVDASMIAIEKAELVEKVYLIFTPNAMTLETLKKYQANPDERVAKGQMQAFEPAAWKKGSRSQKHSLQAKDLGKHVPEFVICHQGEAAAKSALGVTMQSQLYPATSTAYRTDPEKFSRGPNRLDVIEKKIQSLESAAFVLFDHIGITQELNDFRNAGLAGIDAFLNKVDRNKVSNQRKLEVMMAIDDLKNGIVKRSIAAESQHIAELESRRMPNFTKATAEMLRKQNRVSEAEKLEAQERASNEAREKRKSFLISEEHALEKWKKKYESQISVAEIEAFRGSLEKVSLEGGKKAELRNPDHLKWVTSVRLVEAFDAFDQNDHANGFCFNLEHSLCTFGMFGIEKNLSLLKKWINVTSIEHENLYMRANFFNLKMLLVEADAAFKEIPAHVQSVPDISHVQSTPWLKLAKGLVDGFKKTDSAWDEWLRDKTVKADQALKGAARASVPSHHLSKFHRSAEGLMFARISEWTQAVSTRPGKMDKGISAIVGMLLYSRLGTLAEKIGFEEYMGKLVPEKLAELKAKTQKSAEYQKRADAQKANANIDKITRQAQIEAAALAKADAAKVEGSIDYLIKDEQQKVKDKVKITLEEMDGGARSGTNNFRQARLGVILMSIESLSLMTKIGHFNESSRIRAEIAATILSLSSITVDLVYAIAKSIREIAPYEKIVGINKAADIIRGGLKMTSGALSASAGVITVILDAISIREELKKDRADWVLSGIYFGRAIFGSLSTGFGLIAAFSYSGPVLKHVAQRTLFQGSTFALRFLSFAATAADKVALMRTITLIRLARFSLIGVAFTVVEVGYRVFIKDDDLENWLQSCTFRLDKRVGWFGEKPFPDAKTELQELERAMKAVQL